MSKRNRQIFATIVLSVFAACSSTPIKPEPETTESPRVVEAIPTPSSTDTGDELSEPTGSISVAAGNPVDLKSRSFEHPSFSEFSELAGYEDVKGLYPPKATMHSVREGKRLYEKSCFACHGMDGLPARDPSLVRYNMADLKFPQQYKYGSGPRAIYRSIAHGVKAPPMGPNKNIFTSQEIWDLVHYLQRMQRY